MKRSLNLFFAVLLIAGVAIPLQASPRDYSVEISVSIQETPPQIDFTWPGDPDAAQYRVFRKGIGDVTWGDAIAIIDGDATTYSDSNVSVGEAYEYSFRKTEGIISSTFQFIPGSDITFTIYDSWSDGICCQHGLGAYTVETDGSAVAEGGHFGASESTSFTVGTGGEVIVSLILDAFPPETTWTISDNITAAILAEGGPYASAEFGHIFAGIRYPAIEDRGRVLLLVTENVLTNSASHVERLEHDMIADGYRIRRQVVSSGDSVPDVKNLIVSACGADSDIETLLILGSVPVPYSGNLLGVHSNHQGAWPADLYYGDLDGIWTDDTVTNTSSLWPENHNVPGDGKFDQTFLPSDVELQVGRIDLSEMPAFSVSETELIRRYLDKNHGYRWAEISPERRGLIDDNVGDADGLAFAAFGWRNFTPMFGQGTVHEYDYFGTLETESYLWSYGCGGGSNTSCAGVGTTADFVNRNVKTVFTSLYGSYFGDWDKPDNLLRAPLASPGWPLVCFWAGRPTWHMHHMALGHTTGYSTRLSQNNDNAYTVSDGQRQISIALMGDPTLRLHITRPVSNLELTPSGNGVQMTWYPSPDAGEGYHIYRASGLYERFQRINPMPVTETAFTDPSPLSGTNVYMVRAINLEISGSGSYFNLSPGVSNSIFWEPYPTPTAVHPPGVRIILAQNPILPADLFQMTGYLDNPGEDRYRIPVFFLLDVYRNYYFWPSWTLYDPPDHPDVDYRFMDVVTGTTVLNVIPEFPWPDTGESGATGLFFHGAMLNEEMSFIWGEMASVEWGYGF